MAHPRGTIMVQMKEFRLEKVKDMVMEAMEVDLEEVKMETLVVSL